MLQRTEEPLDFLADVSDIGLGPLDWTPLLCQTEADDATPPEFEPVEIDSKSAISERVLQGLPKTEVIEAMTKELESLRNFGVYESMKKTDLPDGAKLIASRWVLVRKPTGEIKARLVAKDFNDGSWVDSFSSTPTQQSLRLALYLSVGYRWTVCAGDFSTAFLHAEIDETDPQYVQPCTPVARPGEVWRLRKALYGLRVAPKLFQDHLTKMFGELGLKRSATIQVCTSERMPLESSIRSS